MYLNLPNNVMAGLVPATQEHRVEGWARRLGFARSPSLVFMGRRDKRGDDDQGEGGRVVNLLDLDFPWRIDQSGRRLLKGL